ncbi:hypothetical protein [Psychrobacillus sp. NPDC096389]|uniref:hypothetical protein n=1 Tax=Psychrobacillus sp. NPDC096389 TaxID=3364490 RepID=UPI00380AE8C3
MFLITRTINGLTENLKDSSSQDNKIFTDFSEAELLVKQLNENIITSMHWSVSEKK